MPKRIEGFGGFDFQVNVEADDKRFWRAITNRDPVENDFRSRMERRAKPRAWDQEGNREDACTYAAISAWKKPDLAILEAQQANEASMEAKGTLRFRYVIGIWVHGAAGEAWAVDEGPESHVSVWAEARHLRASTDEEALPIPGAEE